MSRISKYATYSKYEAYIVRVMDELDLTGKVQLTWRFRYWKRKGGSAYLSTEIVDGKRIGTVDISNRNTHAYTLQVILHELKHIQQMLTNRLQLGYTMEEVTVRGKKRNVPAVLWDGILMKFHRLSRKAERAAYFNDPWEKDAYAYGTDAQVQALFPQYAIEYKATGMIGKSKFFKVTR